MLAGGSKEETEAKMALMKQASENQVQAAKANVQPPAPVAPVSSFNSFSSPSTQMGGMGSQMGMGSRVEPTFASSEVMTGFGGKLAPPPAHQPEL
jgi:hypothetical protein